MRLRRSIKKILNEETDMPIWLRRRITLTGEDLLNEMKSNSLRFFREAPFVYDEIIEMAAYHTTGEILPLYDSQGNEYTNEEYSKWSEIIKESLMSNYGHETEEYLNKVLPKDSFNNDGYIYGFWKHSEINGGSGFSEGYKTWGDLILERGWWFPLDWQGIKSYLDKMDEGSKIILRPGERHNIYGYYFSIIKKKSNK